MGANQSSRKITVVNDEATGVIKISDAVVQRLKGEITGESASRGETPAPADPPQAEPTPPPRVEPPPPPEPEPQAEAPPPPPPPPPVVEAPVPPPPAAAAPVPEEYKHQQLIWQRPIIQYIEEPSLSALKVKQDKEVELKTLEDYWKDRLQKQQEEHTAMKGLTEQEFNKSLKKVETLFATAGTGAVCRDENEALISCYSEHSKQSLRCGGKVDQFVNCVASARMG